MSTNYVPGLKNLFEEFFHDFKRDLYLFYRELDKETRELTSGMKRETGDE